MATCELKVEELITGLVISMVTKGSKRPAWTGVIAVAAWGCFHSELSPLKWEWELLIKFCKMYIPT